MTADTRLPVFLAGVLRGGDGAGQPELVARPGETGRGADRDRRRRGLEIETRPHGHADPGLGRADHLL